MRYTVHITEILGRDVVVDADSKCEAEELVEKLCNTGEIELGIEDWCDRNVEAWVSPDPT